MNPNDLCFYSEPSWIKCALLIIGLGHYMRDILHVHRLWWRTEQDFGKSPRLRVRDPHSPFIFRLTCHRALPAGLAP